jgi:hypothetical protein
MSAPTGEGILARYLRVARQHPLPLWAGLALVGGLQLRRILKERAGPDHETVSVRAYKALPLRSLSRWFARQSERELPEWSRPLLLGAYVKAFGCDLSEAQQVSEVVMNI